MSIIQNARTLSRDPRVTPDELRSIVEKLLNLWEGKHLTPRQVQDIFDSEVLKLEFPAEPTAKDIQTVLTGFAVQYGERLREHYEAETDYWNAKERKTIDALMVRQDLDEHAVLKMGIKWYQIILAMQDEGYTVVRFQKPSGELRPIGVTPGCMGD